MIVYFHTSAVVPLLVAEPASAVCTRLWNDADDVVTVRLLYVEAAAALAQACRLGRLTRHAHWTALSAFDRMWPELAVVEIDSVLVGQAAEFADQCTLRGYDAVHCAAAEQLRVGDTVVASGDRRLLDACAACGMATADVNEA